MIDPRILQQHFQRVQEREMPPKPEVPRIPDPEPLTAVQAIQVPEPEPVLEQEVELSPAPKLEVEEKEPIDLIIDAQPPIDSLIVDELEELEEDTEQEDEPIDDESSDYDPYGYYPGSKF
jgi:hypothetical protein